MIELIKRTYNIWCKKRWLKIIEREVDRYHRMNANIKVQRFVVNELIKEYNDTYNENLCQK